MSYGADLNRLVGKKVQKIFMSHDYLNFKTDQGDVSFVVYGDCCSRSYFWDFLGVEKLLKNGPITQVDWKDLAAPDDDDAHSGECVVAYGVSFVTEDPVFGEVTSMVSFRNDSNGYYGGWMEDTETRPDWDKGELQELTTDCLGLERW